MDRTLDELVHGMYEAVLDPSHWRETLEHLRTTFDARIVVQHAWRSPEAPAFSCSVGVEPDALAQYAGHYHALDPWIARIADLPEQSVVLGSSLTPWSALRVTEFYQDYLCPQDVGRMMAAVDETPPRGISLVSILRSLSSPEFAADEVHLLRQLLPPLHNCLAISRRLHSFETRAAMLEDMLDGLEFGILLIDESTRVLHANAAAERVLLAQTHLLVRRGRLTIRDSSIHAAFLQAVDAAAAASRPLASRRPGALAIDDGQSEPMHVLVAPFRGRPSTVGARAGAIVCLLPRSLGRLGDGSYLAQIYGLTAKECECALLFAEGASIDEVSEALGVTRNTVRTHLRSLFDKTGTRRQGALAAVLMRDMAVLRLLKAQCL